MLQKRNFFSSGSTSLGWRKNGKAIYGEFKSMVLTLYLNYYLCHSQQGTII